MVSIEDLKKAKKARKITLQQISDLSHIPKRTVDKIFSGATENPRVDTLEAIAKALGLSEEKEKKPVANIYELTEKDMELLRLFHQLVPAMQDYAIAALQTMSKSTMNSSASSGGGSNAGSAAVAPKSNKRA